MLSEVNGVESMSPQEANDLSSAVPRLNSTYAHLSFGRKGDNRRRSQDGARKEMDQEVRIFYIRLANELNDLAALHIPCNLLYDRFDPVVEH